MTRFIAASNFFPLSSAPLAFAASLNMRSCSARVRGGSFFFGMLSPLGQPSI